MSPHLEEAWRSLRLADRDIHAFHVLEQDVGTHLSVLCFHAQQAIEKAFKAVLFACQIEFRRTHNLTELALLLRQQGIEPPVIDDCLLRLNPYAVTLRYDDMDIELVNREETAEWMRDIRMWAESLLIGVAKNEIDK